MLELRPNCECCDRDLANGAPEARISTFECTFCASWVEERFGGICPNCGGDFTARPTRPTRPREPLARHPASTQRVVGAHPGCRFA